MTISLVVLGVAACSTKPPPMPPKAPNNELIVGEFERRHQEAKTAARFTKEGYVVIASKADELDSKQIIRSDFILIHGNGTHHPDSVRLQILRNRLSKAYRGQPIVSNEDDHYDFDRPDNNFVAAIGEGVSWGYFDYRMNREGYAEGFQSLPVDWSLSTHRKKGFFNLLKQVTGV